MRAFASLPAPHTALFKWLWVGWLLYFAIVEGYSWLYLESVKHFGDQDTFTHFWSTRVGLPLTFALLAWLAVHFCFHLRG